MRVEIGEPFVIAKGPEWWEVGWGPWQFPHAGIMDDGTLVAGVGVAHDAAEDYGTDRKWFMSKDNGKTWSETTADIAAAGYLAKLPSGDRIGLVETPPQKELEAACEGVDPVFELADWADYYRYDQLKPGIVPLAPKIHRLKKGADKREVEYVNVKDWPHLVVPKLKNGNGVIPPFFFGRMRIAPDGSAWATHYMYGLDPATGEGPDGHIAFFFRSTDNGKNWELVSWLNPKGIDGAHIFVEQDIAWTKSGKAICFLRAKNIFYAISDDGGYTWNTPKRFYPNDDSIEGVDPAVRVLPCGGAVVSTGRPYFLISTSCDPDSDVWNDPVTICKESCSYSEVVPISDNEAFVTYVDFQHPDENDINHKTLMGIKVKFVD